MNYDDDRLNRWQGPASKDPDLVFVQGNVGRLFGWISAGAKWVRVRVGNWRLDRRMRDRNEG